MNAQILLSDIIRTHIPKDPSGLARDVWNLIGNEPIELSEEDTKLIRDFFDRVMKASFDRIIPMSQAEQDLVKIKEVAILTAFIRSCKK